MPLARATTRRLDGSGAFDVPARADFVNRAALEWLDGLTDDPARRPPAFLYLQYMETHHPFTPPAETLSRLRGARPYPQLSGVNGAMLVQPWMPIAMNDALLAGIRNTYDAEVATLERRAVGAGRRKLIAGPGDQWTFYDLVADPAEQHPLSAAADPGPRVVGLEQGDVAQARAPRRGEPRWAARARVRGVVAGIPAAWLPVAVTGG
jgi:hypothetical protein